MKKVLVLAALGFLVWACSDNTNTGSTSNAKMARSESTPPDGEKIYKTYCITCHGIAGDMGASGAHDLSKSELSLEERVQVVTNGRNTMVGFKSLLKPEQIQAVAAYTLKLKKD